MKFDFQNLDETTRELMREEIQLASDSGQIYFSARFNETGKANWLQWLLNAAASYDEHWLAYQIEANSAMKDYEGKATPSGGYTVAHVPHTAAETMAEGQFNRFYIAAICRRAIADGQTGVIAYRARQRDEPRPESIALEGTSHNAEALLNQVRETKTSFRCDFLKPNSGLSVQLGG